MSREHPLSPHRILLIAAVATLALVALLAVRGPEWWRRTYYPLEHADTIAQACDRYDVDPYLVASVINAESGFDEETVSDAGARGLMQLMPETAREVADDAGMAPELIDEEALMDPGVNIELGTCYLGQLVERYEELLEGLPDDAESDPVPPAVAAYNAGSSNVDGWLDVSMEESAGVPATEALLAHIGFPETGRYLEAVLDGRAEYVQLYPEAFE